MGQGREETRNKGQSVIKCEPGDYPLGSPVLWCIRIYALKTKCCRSSKVHQHHPYNDPEDLSFLPSDWSTLVLPWASLGAQLVTNPPALQATPV